MTGSPGANDPFDLERFLAAQAVTYDQALAELVAGRKRTHWMWYVFPQLQGLGRSELARRYAIRDHAEAAAYLAHPILGERLRACARAVVSHTHGTATEILGSPDDLKLRSSATLFAAVAPGEEFDRVLARFFGGAPDPATLALLGPPEATG